MSLEDAIDDMIDTLGTAEEEAQPNADDGKKDDTKAGTDDAKPEGDDAAATDEDAKPADDTQGSKRDTDGDGTADPQPVDKDDEIAKLKQSYSHQSAEWTKEHEKVQALEREMELLKQSIREPKAAADEDVDAGEEDFLAEFRKRKEEDPVEAMEYAIERQSKVMSQQIAKLSKDNESMQEAIANERLQVQEDIMRDQHADYDEIIDTFTPLLKENPEVMKKWHEMGGTAKAAYELALKMKESREILDDPEAYKRKILDEAKNGVGQDNGDGKGEGNPGSTLSKVNSKGAPPKSEKGHMPTDPLDGVLNDIKKEQDARYQRMS